MADLPMGSEVPSHLIPYRYPWVRLFRVAGAAVDGKKLVLAALGLVLLIGGWNALDRLFDPTRRVTPPVATTLPEAPFPDLADPRGTVTTALAIVAEPARTLVAPFRALFDLTGDTRSFFHALLASVWVVAVWGLIGGAIGRIAAVQLTVGERLGIGSALSFAAKRWMWLIGGPLSPLVGVGFLAAVLAVMGVLYWFSPVGTVVAGVLAFLSLLAGLVLAILLLVLAVGWPLIVSTVVVEDEDALDAISRTYAYVTQRPGRYACYVAVVWLVGIAGLLVVAIFARAIVHLAAWGLAFGAPDERILSLFQPEPGAAGASVAHAVHAFWLTVVAMLAYGWVYSHFWTAAVQIYVLLRFDVDGTPVDDVALAEDEGPGFAAELEDQQVAAANRSDDAAPSERVE